MANLSLLVEGVIDEAVGRRVLEHCGHETAIVYGKKGADYIRDKISGFNAKAHVIPIFALVDFMDTRSDCPPTVVDTWVPNRKSQMIFRVVVREIESWLLADRHGLAKFLRIAVDKVPTQPEEIQDPKRDLVNLARKSRSRDMRSLLVPADGTSATRGPAYNSEMRRFVLDYWDVDAARSLAPSLESCIKALKTFG